MPFLMPIQISTQDWRNFCGSVVPLSGSIMHDDRSINKLGTSILVRVNKSQIIIEKKKYTY